MLVGALDIGGSHAAAGIVDLTGPQLVPGSRAERRFDPAADRATLLDAIVGVAVATATAAPPRCWGVAVPGPFDYATGRCTIRDQHKLDSLYGVDLRAELTAALRAGGPGRPAVSVGPAVSFGNDADAFVLGEWAAGAARGARRAVGITLGTGLGSAFLADGVIVEGRTDRDQRVDVPADGRLDLLTYHGVPVEEVVSTRGLVAASGLPGATGLQLARAARAGDSRCMAVFRGAGAALGEVLEPWLRRFRPTHVVIGGGLAGAWDLMEPAFRAACPTAGRLTVRVAELLADAALIGAAWVASRPG